MPGTSSGSASSRTVRRAHTRPLSGSGTLGLGAQGADVPISGCDFPEHHEELRRRRC